jgi:hypothetical protein
MFRESTGTETLWSIQTPAAVDILRQTGRLRGDWRRVSPDERPASRWLVEQLVAQGRFRQRCAPVWAWHTFTSQHRRKPDLRNRWHLPRGTPGVRLHLVVPRESVTCFQFQMWMHVLNRSLVPLTWTDVNSDRDCSQQEMEQSWQRMFDLQAGDCELWGDIAQRQICGCLEELRWEWVTRADRFVAR